MYPPEQRNRQPRGAMGEPSAQLQGVSQDNHPSKELIPSTSGPSSQGGDNGDVIGLELSASAPEIGQTPQGKADLSQQPEGQPLPRTVEGAPPKQPRKLDGPTGTELPAEERNSEVTAKRPRK